MTHRRYLILPASLVFAGCSGAATPPPEAIPQPAAIQQSDTVWTGESDAKPGCPALRFSLTEHNDTLVGWVQDPQSPQPFAEAKGAVERNDAVLVVDKTIWFGARTDAELAIIEPTQCRRRVVMTRQ